MSTAKLIIVGPCKSGKTYFANFLASSTTASSGEYYPTKGVRILEFSSATNLPQTGKPVDCEIELWDCSGDRTYEACWPAITNGAQGVLLLYNQDQFEAYEVESFYKDFVGKIGLKEYQCLLIANKKSSVQGRTIPSPIPNVKQIHTDLGQDPDYVRTEFNEFLGRIFSGIKNVQDQEELGIVGNTQ
ncbi:Intraflagellar transport protein 22-like [Oopsacas minuta]|uniref:Intraflagellar transport protein 22-like n=1 Tax=Oopsacas minuta TaxID=111878 RepID=A0AAV7KHT3_9METZ|nr:Intraflagellar transport protein 22-like [Oopsacas minuta]